MASLLVISDDALDRRVLLPDDRAWLIGRGNWCDVCLQDAEISREHARIITDSGQFVVEDLGSRNGTFLNNRLVQDSATLKDGDVLRVSRFTFTFRCEEAGLDSCAEDESTMIALEADASQDAVVSPDVVQAETEFADLTSDTAEVEIGRRFRSILQLMNDVKSTPDLDVSLPLILSVVCELFPQCENAQIVLVEAEEQLITRAVKRETEEATAVFEVIDRPDSIPACVVRSGRFVSLTGSDARAHAMFGDEIECLICVPITGTGQRVRGALWLESSDASTSACEFQRPLFEGMASVIASAVDAFDAAAGQRELEKGRQQLRMARVIQQRMLPELPPKIAGYSVAHAYDPAHGVGGDYFDYYPLRDNRWVLIIADVCGKGLSASLSAAQLAAEFRHCMELSRSVKAALMRLNHFFTETRVLVTLQFAVLHPLNHTLSIANAGHPAPLRRDGRTGRVSHVATHRSGLPLGIDVDETYHLTNVQVQPNDSLLFYTDGATDAFNRREEVFGISRLESALADGTGDATQSIELIRKRLKRHQSGLAATDDTCLICLQRIAD